MGMHTSFISLHGTMRTVNEWWQTAVNSQQPMDPQILKFPSHPWTRTEHVFQLLLLTCQTVSARGVVDRRRHNCLHTLYSSAMEAPDGFQPRPFTPSRSLYDLWLHGLSEATRPRPPARCHQNPTNIQKFESEHDLEPQLLYYTP